MADQIIDHSLHRRSYSLHATHEAVKKPYLDRFGSIDKSDKSKVEKKDFTVGMVQRLCKSFEASRLKDSTNSDTSTDEPYSPVSGFKRSFSSRLSNLRVSAMFNRSIRLPGTGDRIVVYFTSLRGIRRTYEDCRAVRMIFKGFRVPVDERDISMDSEYRRELQSVLGQKSVSLPQIFIRGKYVGGAEEIRQLHEGGELVKLLKGFPVQDTRLVCESCGDARFLPCFTCNGSQKVFEEEEDQLRRCPDCNENGLIRCPKCNHH